MGHRLFSSASTLYLCDMAGLSVRLFCLSGWMFYQMLAWLHCGWLHCVWAFMPVIINHVLIKSVFQMMVHFYVVIWGQNCVIGYTLYVYYASYYFYKESCLIYWRCLLHHMLHIWVLYNNNFTYCQNDFDIITLREYSSICWTWGFLYFT